MTTEEILLIKQLLSSTSIDVISAYRDYYMLDNILWLIVMSISSVLSYLCFKKIKLDTYDDGLFWKIVICLLIWCILLIPLTNIGGLIEMYFVPNGAMIAKLLSTIQH